MIKEDMITYEDVKVGDLFVGESDEQWLRDNDDSIWSFVVISIETMVRKLRVGVKYTCSLEEVRVTILYTGNMTDVSTEVCVGGCKDQFTQVEERKISSLTHA